MHVAPQAGEEKVRLHLVAALQALKREAQLLDGPQRELLATMLRDHAVLLPGQVICSFPTATPWAGKGIKGTEAFVVSECVHRSRCDRDHLGPPCCLLRCALFQIWLRASGDLRLDMVAGLVVITAEQTSTRNPSFYLHQPFP